MKIRLDLDFLSRICIIGVIALMSIYMINRAGSMNAVDSELQAEKVYQLIEKALIQCYALEGRYPVDSEFEEKMNKYGVILNRDKYIFYYDAFSSNILPDFYVIVR